MITSAAHDAILEYERTGEEPSIDAIHSWDTTAACLALRKAIRIMEGTCEQLITMLARRATVTYPFLNVRASFAWLLVMLMWCLNDHFLIQNPLVSRWPSRQTSSGSAKEVVSLSSHPGMAGGLSFADIRTKAGIRPEKLGQSIRSLATNNCFKEGAPQLSSIICSLLNMVAVRKDIFQNNRLSSQLVAHAHHSDPLLLISREDRFRGA